MSQRAGFIGGLTFAAGVGVAVVCGSGVASAAPDSGPSVSAGLAVDAEKPSAALHPRREARRAGASSRTAPHAAPLTVQNAEQKVASRAVRRVDPAVRAAAVPQRQVSVTLPQLPLSEGSSFTVSTDAIVDVAADYVAGGGDPADSPRFFFGDLAARSLDDLAGQNLTSQQVRTRLGNLAVSGYFGGVWLRDNLRGPAPAAPPSSAPVDLTVSAIGMRLFDALAGGLTAVAAKASPWLASSVAHLTVPVMLALYGYNRGYLEFLLENPPAGVPSLQNSLSCNGFLDCNSSAVPLEIATRYDAALAKLASPTSPGWWEMKLWSTVLESATGAGRFVWQAIASGGGFSPVSYAALVDLSSTYLMVGKAAVLSSMLAAADGDAATARSSLLLQAGLWMWSGSYFAGLASNAPVGTLPEIVVA